MYDEKILNEIMGRYQELINEFCSYNGVPLQYFAELSLQKHPVQVVSSRMYTILSKDMQRFMTTLYQVVMAMDTLPSSNARPRADCFRVVRVMCWDKDKKQVVLFPNLPADAMGHVDVARRGHSYYQKENPYFPSVSMSIQNEIANDLKCEHRQKRWLPVQRGIARLKKRQVTTLGRALANYLECFSDKSKEWEPIKDQQWIEIVATRMLSITKPPTLHFASGKKGFRRMYVYKQGSPSSCMDSRKAHDRLFVDSYSKYNDNKNKAFVENVQPVDWYGDCPVAFGMYMKRAGIILARGIYYRNPKTKQRVATRVYGVTSEFQKLLIKEMRERGIDVTFPCGYSVDKKQRIFDYDVEWSVPTHGMGGSRVTPFPYFDWHPFNYGIFAKRKENVTTFILKNDGNSQIKALGYEMCNLAKTDGYFARYNDRDNDYVECPNCGEEHHCDDMTYMEVSDTYYCCEGCAVSDGHRLYQTGTNIDWRNFSNDFYNDTVHDYQDCVYFSNRLNCLIHGDVLTNTPWALPELDTWATYQRAFSHRSNHDITGDTVYACGVNVRKEPFADKYEYRRLFHTVMYDGTRYDVTVASFSNHLYNHRAGHNFLIQSLLADKHFAYRGLWMEAVPVQHISDMKHVPMVKGLETITNLDVLYEYEQELESQFVDLPREGSSVKAFDNLRDAIIKKEYK
jgi:hypothetical protein